MAREPLTDTIAGLEVTALPLPFSQAEPLIPEVGVFLALVLEELAKALEGVDIKALLGDGKSFDLKTVNLDKLKVDKLAAAMRTAMIHLGDGKLAKLAPKIMASTSVIVADMAGEPIRRELGKAKEREMVFDEHPEAYLPILWFAGRVTFQRYFPGAALTGGATQSAPS